MSAFDANSFLDYTMDAPLVKRPPLPVGEYVGVVKEPKARTWVSPNDPTKSGIAFDYMIEVDVPESYRERTGFESPTLQIKYGVMADVAPDGKSLDMGVGKNGGLRKLREAVDLNKPGDSFNPRAVAGRPVRLLISHREYPEGSGDFFEEIKSIAKV